MSPYGDTDLSGSTLAQVMACCLASPSHCLNQFWLIIKGILWHSPISQEVFMNLIRSMCSYIIATYPRGRWAMSLVPDICASNLRTANKLTVSSLPSTTNASRVCHGNHGKSHTGWRLGGIVLLRGLLYVSYAEDSSQHQPWPSATDLHRMKRLIWTWSAEDSFKIQYHGLMVSFDWLCI